MEIQSKLKLVTATPETTLTLNFVIVGQDQFLFLSSFSYAAVLPSS